MTHREVFVDATAWIAIADASEAYHVEAVRIYTDLLRQRTRLITSGLIRGITSAFTFDQHFITAGFLPTR